MFLFYSSQYHPTVPRLFLPLTDLLTSFSSFLSVEDALSFLILLLRAEDIDDRCCFCFGAGLVAVFLRRRDTNAT